MLIFGEVVKSPMEWTSELRIHESIALQSERIQPKGETPAGLDPGMALSQSSCLGLNDFIFKSATDPWKPLWNQVTEKSQAMRT